MGLGGGNRVAGGGDAEAAGPLANRTDHMEWGELLDPGLGHPAEGSIHHSVVNNNDVVDVQESDGNQVSLREVAVAVESIAHGNARSIAVLPGGQ